MWIKDGQWRFEDSIMQLQYLILLHPLIFRRESCYFCKALNFMLEDIIQLFPGLSEGALHFSRKVPRTVILGMKALKH